MKKFSSLLKILEKIISILPFFSFFSFIFIFFFPRDFKEFGSMSYWLLLIIMFSRPLRDSIPFKTYILDFIVKIRKQLGIMAAVFALTHGIGFLFIKNTDLSFFLNPRIWTWGNFLMWGFLGTIVALPLLLTSNRVSVLIMGKYWKKLQSLSYLMFIFTLLHIGLIKPGKLLPMLSIIFLYIVIFFFAKYQNKKRNESISSIRYVCIPCGYIYDENIGDPDSWVLPGTRFEDIPEDWRCPVCGVGKKDFKKITGKIIKETIDGKVKKVKYINENHDVIELILTLEEKKEVKKWQFFSFHFTDRDGEFTRNYSVANTEKEDISFLIKIDEMWRAGKIFRTLETGKSISTSGPFGDFIFRKNTHKKVFIATGTGLAPIYSMINSLPKIEEKNLFFGVRTKKDLFYKEELEKIPEMKLQIFLSKESKLPENTEKTKYFSGRISLHDLKKFEKNTDFYLCGSGAMIEEMWEILKEKWYKNIFYEKF